MIENGGAARWVWSLLDLLRGDVYIELPAALFAPPGAPQPGGRVMSTATILLIVVLVLLIAGLPTWPYSRGWGYFPSGILGTVLIIVLLMMIFGML